MNSELPHLQPEVVEVVVLLLEHDARSSAASGARATAGREVAESLVEIANRNRW